MKLLNILKMTAVALLISGVISSNAMAASTTGTAEATIEKPLTIVAGTPSLKFDAFISGTPGSIQVFPTVSTNGPGVTGVQLVVNTGNTNTPGFFPVTGEPLRLYNYTVDPTVVLSNGTSSMTATLDPTTIFRSFPGFPSGFPANASLLDPSGEDEMIVGGTLTIVGNETPGAYTGSFNISVDY